jgi:exodeoxyribonuclease V beta subunit
MSATLPPALAAPLSGLNVIEASAGTGKTWTIAGLYLRLVVERGLDVERILTVSFTKAATAELRERIRQRLQDFADAIAASEAADATERRDPVAAALLLQLPRELIQQRLNTALAHFDAASLHTIHAFCQKALAERALSAQLPLATELTGDSSGWRRRLLQDFWRGTISSTGITPERGQLVRWLAKKNYSFETFAQQIDHLCAEGPVDAIRTGSEPPAADFEALEAEWADLRQQWPTARAEVLEAMHQLPLQRNLYRLDHLDGRMLAIDGYLSGDDFAALPEEQHKFFTHSYLTKAIAKASKGDPAVLAAIPPFFAGFEGFVQRLERWQARQQWQWVQLRLEARAWLLRELPVRMLEAGLQGYDDLLRNLDEALAGDDGQMLAADLRERWPAALIDEFQDTDRCQWHILRQLYGLPVESGCALFLVGDPKQAIYRFRGADIDTYLAAVRYCDARFTLTDNHRSVPKLIDALNAAYAVAGDGFGDSGIHYFPVRPGQARPIAPLHDAGEDDPHPLRVLLLEGDTSAQTPGKPLNKDTARALCAAAVAAEIAHMLAQAAAGTLRLGTRPLRAGDIAVLVNTHHHAKRVREALARHGIGAAEQSNESVWASDEAETLQRLLIALAHPTDGGALRAALATDAMGLSGPELLALAEQDTRLAQWQARFTHWQVRLQRHGVLRALREWLRDAAVLTRLAGFQDGERRITNLLHLAELLQAASVEHPDTTSLLGWVADQRRQAQRAAQRDYEAAQLRLDSDAALVQLVTLHAAKGLEYPVTLLPYLWEFRQPDKTDLLVLPDPADRERRLLVAGSDDFEDCWQAHQRSERQEALRRTYVALTRAKNRCLLFAGPFSGIGESPLGELFLDKAADCASQRQAVQKRIDQAPQAIALAAPAGPPPPAPTPAESPVLEAARWHGPLPEAERQTSFTALLLARETTEAQARDHDQQVPATPMPPIEASRPAHRFPRGARAGECLHAVLEILDFRGPAGWQRIVADALRQHGIGAEWQVPLADWLADVLSAPLGEAGTRLCDIPPSRQRREMEFLLPLSGFNPARLSAIANAAGWPVPTLDAQAISGGLRGFIDLLWVDGGGRWWLADYKSNWLGPDDDAYHPNALRAAADDAGYRLQMLLYLLALHRWLQSRQRDYDYSRHIGGAQLLFLRGMRPQRPGQGVLTLQADAALMQRLDALLPRPESLPEAGA